MKVRMRTRRRGNIFRLESKERRRERAIGNPVITAIFKTVPGPAQSRYTATFMKELKCYESKVKVIPVPYHLFLRYYSVNICLFTSILAYTYELPIDSEFKRHIQRPRLQDLSLKYICITGRHS
jgi:hypothetical protein